MAKIYKEQQIPAQTKTVLAQTLCDLCGKDLNDQDVEHVFEVHDVTISCRTGESYPEGGSGQCVEIDLCTVCFLGKLVPWFAGQGAVIKHKEWDW
jgi:hypothetical protein